MSPINGCLSVSLPEPRLPTDPYVRHVLPRGERCPQAQLVAERSPKCSSSSGSTERRGRVAAHLLRTRAVPSSNLGPGIGQHD
jgi:hypothetical protein